MDGSIGMAKVGLVLRVELVKHKLAQSARILRHGTPGQGASAQARSRRPRLSTLPTELRGSSGKNSMTRGLL